MKHELKSAMKKPFVSSKLLKYWLILFKRIPMGAEQGSAIGSFLPLIILFAIFYFLIIRPQQKHQKAHKAMLESLKKGDQIITSGGLIAVIAKTEEDFIKIKLNDDTIVKLDRAYVAKKVEIGEDA